MHRSQSMFLLALATLAGTAAANQPGTLKLKAGDVRVADMQNVLHGNQLQAQRLPERMVIVLDG